MYVDMNYQHIFSFQMFYVSVFVLCVCVYLFVLLVVHCSFTSNLGHYKLLLLRTNDLESELRIIFSQLSLELPPPLSVSQTA